MSRDSHVESEEPSAEQQDSSEDDANAEELLHLEQNIHANFAGDTICVLTSDEKLKLSCTNKVFSNTNRYVGARVRAHSS